MNLLVIVIFAVAISIDSFVVGLSYGIKNIVLPKRAIFIVTVFSGFLLLVFMLAGSFLAQYLSEMFICGLAACMLATLGICKLISAYQESANKEMPEDDCLLLHLPIPFVPYAIQILREPERAAKKIQGNGHKVECEGAWGLGLAMAFDAIGGGFAASLAGFPIVITVLLSVIITGSLLVIALQLGRSFRQVLLLGDKKAHLEKFFNYFPGILMIGLAAWKIFM